MSIPAGDDPKIVYAPDATTGKVTITVKDDGQIEMPFTGGVSIALLIIGGIGLVVLAGLRLARNRREDIDE